MSKLDPYVQHTLTRDVEVIVAVRPIVLAQGSDSIDGVVNIAGDRNLVVYADKVTIQGNLQFPPQRLKPGNGTDGADGVDGCSVVILAREIDTIPGKAQAAAIDVSGGHGETSGHYWPAAAGGRTGAPAEDGECGDGYVEDEPEYAEAGESATTLDVSDDEDGDDDNGSDGDDPEPADSVERPDPACAMNGRKGANGGTGGKGGTISVRCAHFTTGASLNLKADGGDGGDGLQGQEGGVGGIGGSGNKGGTACILYDDVLKRANVGQTMWTAGGNGGRGGFGGDGGDGGGGGAAGAVMVRILEGTAATHIDPVLVCKPGSNSTTLAKPGKPGDGGAPGWSPKISIMVPRKGASGGLGQPGTLVGPDKAGKAVKIDLGEACDQAALTEGLQQPLTGFLLMLFERIRTDLLISATSSRSADDELDQRIGWLSTLLKAYSPQDPAEIPTLDGLRGQADTLAKRASKGLDFYGHGRAFAPLGSMDFHRDSFANARQSLKNAQEQYDILEASIEANTVSEQHLSDARKALLDEQTQYDDAASATRETVLDLFDRIKQADQNLQDQRTDLLAKDHAKLSEAVNASTGLTLSDLFDCLSQFAFFGENGPQQAAMVIGQLGKLADTGITECVADDGTKENKTYVLDKLTEVTDLHAALTGYKGGNIQGISLQDPGAVKLLGQQKQLDDICDKFWNYEEAQTLKRDFDEYVAAVLARNSDILSYNENLSLLHGYLAGSQQAAAAASDKADEMAVLSMPGAPTMLSQLGRILQTTKNECIHQLFLVSRAYWFWSLDPDDELSRILTDVSAGSELALTDAVLDFADTRMYLDRATKVESLLSDPGGWLPDLKSSTDGRGFMVDFDNASHPIQMKTFRDTGTAIFHVLPAQKQTSKSESPFAGWSDVRLRKVRAWVYGAKTSDNILQVEIEHHGPEKFVTPEGAVETVIHPEVTIPFRYNFKAGVGKTACLDSEAGATTDGDIAFSEDGKPMLGLIGPFTAWRITIRAKDNLDLDLKSVDRLSMEFFVHGRLFKTHPERLER